jgi:hypothetical protein
VTGIDRSRLASELRESAARTPDCIPIERLGEPLNDDEQRHLGGCARCQTEVALWQAFDASQPGEDDGAAVQWIVAETGRRRAAKSEPGPSRSWWMAPGRLAAMLATLVVIAGVGYTLRDREPEIRDVTGGAQTYRTAQIEVLGPLGDVQSAPRELRWKAITGAVRYDVVILEIDRTPVWTGTAPEPRLAMPSSVTSRFVADKPFLWEVTARSASSAALATSGPQRFRVTGP